MTTGKLPSSGFFGVGGATPAPDRGIEILGLLIYTYEPNDWMENSALNSPNLRGKIPLKKKAVRYAVAETLSGYLPRFDRRGGKIRLSRRISRAGPTNPRPTYTRGLTPVG